jgi:hypothetical protein
VTFHLGATKAERGHASIETGIVDRQMWGSKGSDLHPALQSRL